MNEKQKLKCQILIETCEEVGKKLNSTHLHWKFHGGPENGLSCKRACNKCPVDYFSTITLSSLEPPAVPSVEFEWITDGEIEVALYDDGPCDTMERFSVGDPELAESICEWIRKKVKERLDGLIEDYSSVAEDLKRIRKSFLLPSSTVIKS